MIDVNDIFDGAFSTTRRYDGPPALYDEVTDWLKIYFITEDEARNISRFFDQSALDLVIRAIKNIQNINKNNSIASINLKHLVKVGVFKNCIKRTYNKSIKF